MKVNELPTTFKNWTEFYIYCKSQNLELKGNTKLQFAFNDAEEISHYLIMVDYLKARVFEEFEKIKINRDEICNIESKIRFHYVTTDEKIFTFLHKFVDLN